jgi:glycosyltransferase involved in cell wall biosynthesis
MNSCDFDITIVVPTVRKSANLMKCVEAIIRAAQDSKIRSEILVVDNSLLPKPLILSTAMIGEFHKVDVLVCAKGVNKARNLGLKNANSPVVLFIDDDCIVPNSKFLQTHLFFHRENKEIFAAGGMYSVAPETNQISRCYIERQNDWLSRGMNSNTKKVNFLIGGNMSIKKEFSIKFNLFFDEMILYGGSETEFFTRAFNAGMECYLLEAPVIHKCQINIFEYCKKQFKQGRGKKYRENKFGYVLANSIYVNAGNKQKIKSILPKLGAYFFKIGYGKE